MRLTANVTEDADDVFVCSHKRCTLDRMYNE